MRIFLYFGVDLRNWGGDFDCNFDQTMTIREDPIKVLNFEVGQNRDAPSIRNCIIYYRLVTKRETANAFILAIPSI